MRVLIVRHSEEDSAGFIGAAFEARRASLEVVRFPGDGPLPDAGAFDHVVVLGSASSVNDDQPWIAAELDWLRRIEVPVLGICFGAQALCAARGGRVERAPRQEIGWVTVSTSDPSLVPTGPWLEFHGDRCVVPAQARVLAWNDAGVQAYSIGRHLGVQFHPEVDGAQLKGWLDMGADTVAIGAGVDLGEFVGRTIREEPAARARADRVVAAALRIGADAS
jgi:GMP synthase-like glutamine amidotransferase